MRNYSDYEVVSNLKAELHILSNPGVHWETASCGRGLSSFPLMSIAVTKSERSPVLSGHLKTERGALLNVRGRPSSYYLFGNVRFFPVAFVACSVLGINDKTRKN